jgi:ubiquinone/menaquinone biosynthesis C-methylase UbiE
MYIPVDKGLKRIYEEYHGAGISEWRRIAAVDKAKHILALCQNIKHEKIVEVGAGEGAVLARLDELGFAKQMFALEIAESAVKTICSRNIPSLAECKIFDGYAMPYQDKQFDIAIATHVIEHVEHPRLLLKELKRVATHVFIEIPLEYNFRGIRDIDQAFKYGHINFFNPLLFSKLLKNMGFEIVDSRIRNSSLQVYKFQSGWKGLPKYLLKQIFLKLSPRMATKFFSYVYLVLCK